MDPDAIAIFGELADRSASERERYYATHHVSEALRADVEFLLRFDGVRKDLLHGSVVSDAANDRLENDSTLPAEAPIQAGLQPSAAAHTTADQPGSWFGCYRLRERLGEGGMGVVWLADQEQPIRRTVAIKVVKPGTDSDEVLSRFGSERQALQSSTIRTSPRSSMPAQRQTDGHTSSWSMSQAKRSRPLRTSIA